MMQVDLARLLEVGKVTIGGLVDRLESSGHVERRPDPEDRRAKRVYITEQGWNMIRSMISVAEKMNRKVMAGVSDEDLETVERSEEHTSELKSLMRISYAVFCLKTKKYTRYNINNSKYTYNYI